MSIDAGQAVFKSPARIAGLYQTPSGGTGVGQAVLVTDTTTSTSTSEALSANQGRLLSNEISALLSLPESQRRILYLQASHNQDINFATVNVPEPIPFDTNDERAGIVHDTITDNSEITIPATDIYVFVAQTAGEGDRVWNVTIVGSDRYRLRLRRCTKFKY